MEETGVRGENHVTCSVGILIIFVTFH